MTQLRIIVIDGEPDMMQLVCDVAMQVYLDAQQYHYAKDFMRQYADDYDAIVPGLI